MSGVDVGSAYMTIIPSAKGFAAKLQADVGGEVAKVGTGAGEKAGKGFKAKFGGAIAGFMAPVAGALAGGAVISFLKDSVQGLKDHNRIAALTGQVIKSTGGAAKVTADQVGALSDKLEMQTGVDGDLIQNGANMLLTFTNIRNEVGKGNDIFNQATQTVTDMSVALGQDTKSSAIQLGKALNDPVKGVTALQKVGVSFTQQQKDQIAAMVKAGNTVGAQKVILGELSKEFGGAAAAQATFGDKAAAIFHQVQDAVGAALLPVLDWLQKKFIEIGPAIVGFATQLGPALTGAAQKVGPILAQVGTAVIAFGKGLIDVLGFVGDHSTSFTVLAAGITAVAAATAAHTVVLAINSGALKAWFVGTKAVQVATKAWAAVQWLLNIAMSANPIGLIVLGIAALVAGVIFAFQHSERFRAALEALWGAVTKVAGVVAGALVSAVQAVGGFFAGLGQGVASAAVSVWNFFTSLPGKIVSILAGAGKWLVTTGRDIVVGLATSTYNTAVAFLTWWINLPGVIVTKIGNVASTLAGKGADFIKGLATSTYNGAVALLSWYLKLPGVIVQKVGNVASTLTSKGKALISGLLSGVTGAAGAVWSWLGNVASTAASKVGNLASTLVAKGKSLLSGFASGVTDGAKAAWSFLSGLAGKAAGAVGNLGSVLLGKGKELIQGLVNGIESKISAITNAMSKVTDKIKGFLPGSPVREGPLRAWNNGRAGKALIGDLLAPGLLAGIPAVESAMSGVAGSIQATGSLSASAASSAGAVGASDTFVTVMLDGQPVRAMVKAENREANRDLRRAVTSRAA